MREVPPLQLPPLEELLGKPKPISEQERNELEEHLTQVKEEMRSLKTRFLVYEEEGSPALPAPHPTLPRDPEQAAIVLSPEDV